MSRTTSQKTGFKAYDKYLTARFKEKRKAQAARRRAKQNRVQKEVISFRSE